MPRLATIAAALLTLPAAAQDGGDLTATYRETGAKLETRFEIAANGDLRVDIGADYYLLSHDGIDYVVTAGPGGPSVARVDDIVAARSGRKRQAYPASNAVPSSRGKTVVNGRTGIAYGYPPANGNPLPPYLVVSSDPRLAPLGRAFRHYRAIADAVSEFEPDPIDRTGALLGAGAPLHFYAGDLVALDRAPIPAPRFALPAAPETLEAIRQDAGSDDDLAGRTMIKRAVFAGGELWLLTDDGSMMRIDPGAHELAEVETPDRVWDLCRANGAPVVIAGNATRWTLHRWGGAGWDRWQTIAAHGEELVALNCADDRYDLLTNRRLIEISAAGERSVPLSGPIGRGGLIVSLHDDGRALFAGLDAGEWGGGMVRIDRATGAVSAVEHPGKNLCDGPLNTACDPVNGIAAEPGKPDCLLVAVGLIHMRSHGRLAEVCGDRIRTYYFKPYTIDPGWHPDPRAPEPHSTVPFYGLAASGDTLWAVGLDGLYRIEADGRMSMVRLPTFERIGGVAVSFALPGMVLVQTTINSRMALSGAVPLLVPR